MKKKSNTIARVAIITITVLTLALVAYIMINRIGLSDDLDFGAGAYYYADIPEYDKVIDWDVYQYKLPYWVYLLLFFAWGWVVWKIWKRLDK